MPYLLSFAAIAALGLYLLGRVTQALCDAFARLDSGAPLPPRTVSRYRPDGWQSAVRVASLWMMTRIA